MNKYQEALDDLSYPDINSPCYGNKCGETDCGDCNIRGDILTLKELVDKATPKKPILSDSWKDEEQTDIYDENGFIDPIVSICPNCRKYGIFDFEYGEKFNYCKHCGQAIDWSDEDENAY